jgi:alkanesulfonate monooxygenase SsuD/methylene tetrahydromethanopterin reductase-like flavin-dependent oxidoreductase (luciferase family)
MRLGLFLMPFHHHERPVGQALEEDRQAIILADKLGYAEAWVGEHFTSASEPVTNPLMFCATLLPETKQIVFGTGVINLPQRHPVQVAAEAAMFDHLAKGRFIMGVGPGGLASDMEVMATAADPAARPKVTREAIDIILQLWRQNAPWRFDQGHFKFALEQAVWPQYGVGQVIRPYQQPHPPIALSLVTPNSESAVEAGRNGWIPVTGNFSHYRHATSHWQGYARGAAEAGRRADPATWRVSRSILVTESDAEADDYLADAGSALHHYWSFFHFSAQAGGRGLNLYKPDSAIPDAEYTVDRLKRAVTFTGSPKRVMDQLIAMTDVIGPFGTLLLGGHEWDKPAMWRRSLELMASDVAPRLGQHMRSRMAAE